METLGSSKSTFLASQAPYLMYGGYKLLKGQNLKAGTLVGMIADGNNKGKLKIWNTTANDGTQDLFGVLLNDVDATDADTPCTVIVLGAFIKSGLTAAQAIEAGVYKHGTIIIVEDK